MTKRIALGAVVGTLVCILSASVANAQSATYEVGPGKPYANIGDVPWESLQPGATVLINWRSTPYKEKWVIARQGTASAPITVRGVTGPAGELPVIDGAGATTRLALDFWSETRGVIKIGGSSIPSDVMPRYITIENLDIRAAHTPNTFLDDNGSTQSYSANASAIFVEKGENITVRNCALHDCGNGFFVASSDDAASRDILVEGCSIYDNGNNGSIYEHNNYTAAIGITFQYNYFGALKTGAGGNNLKDRSAGLVVRYNWIEGGNRQLDLVDAEDSSLIRGDARYGRTFVYGNVLVEPNGAGNRQICHYGGDSGATATYRKGTLYFYDNTVVSLRTDRTTLLRLSTNSERCDLRNNVVYTAAAAGSTLSLVDDTGLVDLSHNWFKPGWVFAFVAASGTLVDDHTSITGTSPGFVDEAGQNYKLAAGSACVNGGTVLDSDVLPEHDVVRQYVKHRSSEARPSDGVLDVGAYESGSSQPTVQTSTALSIPANPAVYGQPVTMTATVSVSPSGTASGTVRFYSGSTQIGTGTLSNGVASFTKSNFAIGTYSITARYVGNSSTPASVSSASSLAVNKRRTATALTVTPSTTVSVSTSVTYRAAVSIQSPGTGTATGSVRFYDGSTLVATRTLSGGVATYTRSYSTRGTHPIKAVYVGNSTTDTSESSVVTVTVVR